MNPFFDRMLKMHVDCGVTMVGDDKCFYDVISREFEPKLPNFVGAINATEGTYFISDETPPEFRPLVIGHEHRCARHRKAGRAQYCQHAVCEELAAIPPSVDAKGYISFRSNFFEGLVRYYEQLEKADPAFVDEIRKSRDYLSTLLLRG